MKETHRHLSISPSLALPFLADATAIVHQTPSHIQMSCVSGFWMEINECPAMLNNKSPLMTISYTATTSKEL
jgi:lipocalin